MKYYVTSFTADDTPVSVECQIVSSVDPDADIAIVANYYPLDASSRVDEAQPVRVELFVSQPAAEALSGDREVLLEEDVWLDPADFEDVNEFWGELSRRPRRFFEQNRKAIISSLPRIVHEE